MHDGAVKDFLDAWTFFIVFAKAHLDHCLEVFRILGRDWIVLSTDDFQNESSLIVRLERMLQSTEFI